MQSSIVSEAKAIENELIAHRRHLHQNPELGFDLPETTAYVMQQLREYGYEPKAVGKAGISAVVGPDGGKTFLIRGDMCYILLSGRFLKIFCVFLHHLPRYHDLVSTAQTFQPEICSHTQDLPFLTSTWMGFFQFNNITDLIFHIFSSFL